MSENDLEKIPVHEFLNRRIVDPKRITAPLFKDWSHGNLRLTEMPVLDLPNWPRSTSISNGQVFLMLPVVSHVPASQSNTSVIFWSKTDDEVAPESHDGEFTKAVHSLYQSYLTGINLSVTVNPKPGDVQRVICKHDSEPSASRTLFHFITDNSHEDKLQGYE